MAENIKIPGEFDDANDFWKHPIYDKYESNRLGVVRHVENKKDIGCVGNDGYNRITVRRIYGGPVKNYLKHRFIFECFHGLITNKKLVIDHINNIKTDNRLENLQLITQSQNSTKENRKGEKLPAIRVRATNLNSGELSEYCSKTQCSRKLDIHRESISRVLKGITKTATSKKDKCKYKFEKI